MAAGLAGSPATGYEDFFADDGIPKWWKTTRMEKNGETSTVWRTRHPGAGHSGELGDHTVTEHDDGTITVSPSILCRTCGWHGYLERGIWRQD